MKNLSKFVLIWFNKLPQKTKKQRVGCILIIVALFIFFISSAFYIPTLFTYKHNIRPHIKKESTEMLLSCMENKAFNSNIAALEKPFELIKKPKAYYEWSRGQMGFLTRTRKFTNEDWVYGDRITEVKLKLEQVGLKNVATKFYGLKSEINAVELIDEMVDLANSAHLKHKEKNADWFLLANICTNENYKRATYSHYFEHRYIKSWKKIHRITIPAFKISSLILFIGLILLLGERIIFSPIEKLFKWIIHGK